MEQPPGLIDAVFVHKISERQVSHALKIAAERRYGQAGQPGHRPHVDWLRVVLLHVAANAVETLLLLWVQIEPNTVGVQGFGIGGCCQFLQHPQQGQHPLKRRLTG